MTSRSYFLGSVAVVSGLFLSLFVVWRSESAMVEEQIRGIAVRWGLVEGPESHWVREAHDLLHRDPEQDARDAAWRGDHRLAATTGIGIILPGMPGNRDEAMSRRYGVFIVDPGGCVTSSPEQEYFRRTAWEYALRYNRIMVRLFPDPPG